jgi:hypothetical protein
MLNNYNSNSMKNKFKILILLTLGVFLFSTCQKDPDLRIPDLKIGVIPVITKDATKDITIDALNLATFAGTVKVGDFLYKDKPKSMNLMVTMNDDPDNKGVAKVIDINSLPTTCDITIASLVDILPLLTNANQILPGDNFHFYADLVLEDGTAINGLDTLYNAYSSGVANQPGSSTDVTYPVLCPFDLSKYCGTYSADDGYPSDLCDITVALDPDDPFGLIISNIWGPPNSGGTTYPLKVSVSPTYPYDMSISSSQKIRDWVWVPAYSDVTVYSVEGTLDACLSDITEFVPSIECGAGNFGGISFILTRK